MNIPKASHYPLQRSPLILVDKEVTIKMNCESCIDKRRGCLRMVHRRPTQVQHDGANLSLNSAVGCSHIRLLSAVTSVKSMIQNQRYVAAYPMNGDSARRIILAIMRCCIPVSARGVRNQIVGKTSPLCLLGGIDITGSNSPTTSSSRVCSCSLRATIIAS